jgi:CrcB protein
MTHIHTYLLVALGGAAGACMRYSATQLVGRWAGHGFPFGTMAVNVAGSFCMGVLVIWLASKAGGGQPLRLLFATGLLGGFTTFSAFSLDAYTLMTRGLYSQAGLYMAGSLIIALAALVAGVWAGRLLWA